MSGRLTVCLSTSFTHLLIHSFTHSPSVRNLFSFLFRFAGHLVFGLLEVVSLYLLIRNSSYQRAAFFNSANDYAGRVLELRTQVVDYFRLVDVNRGWWLKMPPCASNCTAPTSMGACPIV